MASAKTAVDSFREVVQDLLVPELKAVTVSVDFLRNEMRILHDSTREEMKLTKDALREEMKIRNEGLERTIREGEHRNQQLIQSLSEKLDFANKAGFCKRYSRAAGFPRSSFATPVRAQFVRIGQLDLRK